MIWLLELNGMASTLIIAAPTTAAADMKGNHSGVDWRSLRVSMAVVEARRRDEGARSGGCRLLDRSLPMIAARTTGSNILSTTERTLAPPSILKDGRGRTDI